MGQTSVISLQLNILQNLSFNIQIKLNNINFFIHSY